MSEESSLSLDASPPPSISRERDPDVPTHEYHETFVWAVRETPVPPPELIKINSREYAVTGHGLEGYKRRPVSLTDLDIYDLLPIEGQAALKEIEETKIRRARERTMQELRNILNRVKGALEELRQFDTEIKERERQERKRKREEQQQKKRKKFKESQQKKIKELRVNKIKRQKLKEEQSGGLKNIATEHDTERVEEKGEGVKASNESKEEKEKSTDEEKEEGVDDEEGEEKGQEGDEEDTEDTEDTEEIESSSSEWETDEEEEEVQEDDRTAKDVIMDGPMPVVKQKRDARATIKKVAYRHRVLKTISSYLEHCALREDLMQQMKQWIEASVSEEFSAIKPVLCFSPGLLEDSKPGNISTDIERLYGIMRKLKDIADSLGIGDKAEDVFDEASGPTLSMRPPTQGRATKPTASIFNEDELGHPDTWKTASNYIRKVMDDAEKTTPARRVRQAIANAGKQFKVMSMTMDRRVEKIRQLDMELLDSGAEIARLKKNNEILRDTKKKLQVKFEKIEYKNSDLLQKLRETEEHVAELTNVIGDYKKKESLGLYDQSSEESLRSVSSTKAVSMVSLVPSEKMLAPTGEKQQITYRTDATQPSQPAQPIALPGDSDKYTRQEVNKVMKEYEKIKNELKTEKEKKTELETLVNTMNAEKVQLEQGKVELEIKLEEHNRQAEKDSTQSQKRIEQLEMENVKIKNELECQEEMIKYQEDRITQYSEELSILEERLHSFPPTPAAQSRASISQVVFRQERRRSSLATEPATAKQMLAKVRQQHEQEIQSLKDHLARENQRNQADLRRLEQEHKKDTQNIHKESLQVLRSINRFKDSIANILDRESLLSDGHEMRKLSQLPIDDSGVDTRQMLARMAILSTDLLVSMELCLSKAMISKRLEMKDTVAIKGLVQKDLDRHMEALKKAKEFGLLQMEKFKGAREDIQEMEMEHMRAKHMEEAKQMDLVDQFKEVVNQYGDLKKQSVLTRKQHQEEMKRKTEQVKRVMRRSEELNKTVEEQKIIIKELTSQWRSRRIGQVYISREDQQMNLKILQEALEKNQISDTLCQMTSGMIKESLDYPQKRFIALVKKYFHYRRTKEVRERYKQMKVQGSLSQRIADYLKLLEERSEMQKKAWSRKKQEFVQMRADIIEQLNIVITRVNEETGILLTRPLDLSTSAADEQGIEAASTKRLGVPKGRSRYRRLAEAEQCRAPPGARAPSPLSGTNMAPDYERHILWKIPRGYSSSIVTTPRILEMDVNRSRMNAQSIVTDIAMGQWSKTTGYLQTRYKMQPQDIGRSISEPAYNTNYSTGIQRRFSLPPVATLYPEEKISQKTKKNK